MCPLLPLQDVGPTTAGTAIGIVPLESHCFFMSYHALHAALKWLDISSKFKHALKQLASLAATEWLIVKRVVDW